MPYRPSRVGLQLDACVAKQRCARQGCAEQLSGNRFKLVRKDATESYFEPEFLKTGYSGEIDVDLMLSESKMLVAKENQPSRNGVRNRILCKSGFSSSSLQTSSQNSSISRRSSHTSSPPFNPPLLTCPPPILREPLTFLPQSRTSLKAATFVVPRRSFPQPPRPPPSIAKHVDGERIKRLLKASEFFVACQRAAIRSGDHGIWEVLRVWRD